MTTGDSSSHRHATLWVLFDAWPKCAGGVPALLCSRDQSELLYLRDKAAPKHPALFFSFIFFSAYFFCSFSRFSNENAATHRWTSGWKCRQGDKSIVVWGSIQSKNSGAHKPHCADKDRNHRPIAISFLLTLIFRYGTNLFFFSLVLSWCLYLREKNEWLPSWKHIVCRSRIWHNIKILCLERCLKHLPPEGGEKVQPSVIWNRGCGKYFDKLHSHTLPAKNKLTKWGFGSEEHNRSCKDLLFFRNSSLQNHKDNFGVHFRKEKLQQTAAG